MDHFKMTSFLLRKAFVRTVTLVVLLIGSLPSMTAQVTTSVDSTSIQIGEEIEYTISVQADTTDLVVFPEGQTFLPLELIESYKIDTTFEQAKYKLIKKYGLTQFDSGRYTIPPQKIVINDRVAITDSVRVEVRDVVVDTTQQKMFDIKPALEVENLPINWGKVILWLVPLLLLLAIVGYALFRRKKRKEAEQRQLPPYEEAMSALHTLDESSLLREQRSKEYYSLLTEIVKRYLDREVDETALESTSDELIARLQLHKDAGHFNFSNEMLKKLDAVLKRADLVKFAKMQQAEGQASADRNTVEQIINETKAAIPEPTADALEEDLQYQELQRKKRQRRKWVLGGLGAIAAVILSLFIYGNVIGFQNLADTVFGNELKEMAESRWYKSEYGTPAIIIETPDILVRVTDTVAGQSQTGVLSMDAFTLGGLTEPLYVNVSAMQLQQQQAIDLERALDASLVQLEQGGAKNMLVKREEFETQKGVTGLKAYGEFNVALSNNKVLAESSQYELLIFAQEGAIQQILVVYQDDERFAEGIKERIINSVELEIQETQQTP